MKPHVLISYTASSACKCHEYVVHACDKGGISWQLVEADSFEETKLGIQFERAGAVLFDTSRLYRGLSSWRFYPRRWAEQNQIPVIGNSSAAVFVCDHKPIAKLALEAAGISCPKGTILAAAPSRDDLETLALQLGLPCVLKPMAEQGSQGLSLCHNLGELREAIEFGLCSGMPLLVEEFIPGDELAVLVVEGLPQLPIFEIPLPEQRIYTERAKDTGKATFSPYPKFTSRQNDELHNTLSKAWSVLGLRGFARFDLRLNERGEPVILEANAKPSLERGSITAPAMASIGKDVDDLLFHLIHLSQ